MAYKSTGIFFHYQRGERLKDFPLALEGIIDKDHVMYCDALYDAPPDSIYDIPPVPVSELYKVHSAVMVEQIKQIGVFEGALYSVAGTVLAAEKICSGEITNAFVFTGYGDHHAGKNFYGGGCYFNGAAINLFRFGLSRGQVQRKGGRRGFGGGVSQDRKQKNTQAKENRPGLGLFPGYP